MQSSTKDQIAGAVKEVKGKVKEKVGHLIGNTRLEDEGQSQNVAGKVRKKIGQIKRVFEA